ncbi:hypothetical protein JCM31598_28030 [Desulfonatronum parangueonense]
MAIMRSLHQHGVSVFIAGVDTDIRPLAVSRYCTSSKNIYKAATAASTFDSIKHWWETFKIPDKPILFFNDDVVATWVAQEDDHLQKWSKPCSMHPKLALSMLSKDQADIIARKNGLLVPQSKVICSLEDMSLAADELSFPVLLKPSVWSKKGKFLFKTQILKDRTIFLENTRRYIDGQTMLIAQEYIPGDDDTVEFCLFYRSKDGQNIYSCTGRKIRQYPIGNGVMASGVTEEIKDLEELSALFLSNIDARGIGGIEFKRHQDKLYFIEMSIRPEMFHPIAISAGVDLVWAAYADLIGLKNGAKQKQTRKVSYINEVHYLLILFKERKIKLVFRDLLRIFRLPVVFSMLNLHDPVPILIKNFNSIYSKIIKLSSRAK